MNKIHRHNYQQRYRYFRRVYLVNSFEYPSLLNDTVVTTHRELLNSMILIKYVLHKIVIYRVVIYRNNFLKEPDVNTNEHLSATSRLVIHFFICVIERYFRVKSSTIPTI